MLLFIVLLLQVVSGGKHYFEWFYPTMSECSNWPIAAAFSPVYEDICYMVNFGGPEYHKFECLAESVNVTYYNGSVDNCGDFDHWKEFTDCDVLYPTQYVKAGCVESDDSTGLFSISQFSELFDGTTVPSGYIVRRRFQDSSCTIQTNEALDLFPAGSCYKAVGRSDYFKFELSMPCPNGPSLKHMNYTYAQCESDDVGGEIEISSFTSSNCVEDVFASEMEGANGKYVRYGFITADRSCMRGFTTEYTVCDCKQSGGGDTPVDDSVSKLVASAFVVVLFLFL